MVQPPVHGSPRAGPAILRGSGTRKRATDGETRVGGVTAFWPGRPRVKQFAAAREACRREPATPPRPPSHVTAPSRVRRRLESTEVPMLDFLFRKPAMP